MSILLVIIVAAAVGALAVGLILKIRLRDQEVLEELVGRDVASGRGESSSATDPDAPERYDISVEEFEGADEGQGDEEMTTPLSQSHRSVRDTELRRSSRIERPVSLVVLGTNRRGEIFQERTSALSVNLHGCRYSSRHEYAPEGWVTLQVTGTDGANSRPVRARVRSVFSAQNARELCQVGVELETPGNIWGISTPPEDWQRLLGISNSAARATAVAPAFEAVSGSERRAEVTVFPGPSANSPASAEEPAEKETVPTKSERVVVTAEQLLQALQGKLQLAAEKSVQAALASQLDDAVKTALGRIEEGWKASVRQTEEFAAARRVEAQSIWAKELDTYRHRAEDVAQRIEALTTLAQQALADSHRFVERFANETAPQLQARLTDSFASANADLEARAAEVCSRHLAQLNEEAQQSLRSTRAQLDDSLAQARALAAPASLPPPDAVSQEHLDLHIAVLRGEMLDATDKRLGKEREAWGAQLEQLRNRNNDLTSQLQGLALEGRQARQQHEQAISEVRSLVSNAAQSVTQDQLHSTLNVLREQLLSHLEWRLGEVSGHFDQLSGQNHERTNQLSQQLERLVTETREQLAKVRTVAEQSAPSGASQDLHIAEEAVGNAAREFENTAARVSDRYLVRLMEQKQMATQEAALELEARTSEARAMLQKASNNLLEEFRHRVEGQVEHVLAEATDRANSSFASLDAESRATVEVRRRTLEADVARAAEQSTAEFRSGIKAFLYSCLVAAVSAVDQHAQTTLAGLSADPGNVQRELEAGAKASENGESPLFPPKAASNS